MASGDIDKSLCRVCKTVFNFKGPEPYLLPCLHPACKPCVDSGHETITCYTCRQFFNKADHVFPKHCILSKDLFQLTLKQKPSDILCTFRNDGSRAEMWCPKCKAFLCFTCKEFHKDVKSTRSHALVYLQNCFDPENDSAKTYGYCQTHTENPYEVFDSSCGCLVCYKCLRYDHSTCAIEDIDKAFEKMKESELDNSIGQIVSKLDVISEMQEKAQDLAKTLFENSKRVRDEVVNIFSDIRGTLDMREKMLLEETNQSFHEVQNTNREWMEVLKQEKTRCEAALMFIKRSKDISDPVQALMMKKTIDDRTTSCIEADLQEMDGRESSISLSTQDLKDVKQSIETFAGLYSVLDENTTIYTNSGPTTRERQQKKILKLQRNLQKCHQIFEDIRLLSEQGQSVGKIDLEIPGISAITKPCEFNSEQKYIRNMPWKLGSEFTRRSGVPGIGLYLYSIYPGNWWGNWTCEVKFRFAIRRGSFSQRKREELTYTFTQPCGFGFHDFISMNELLNPANGYVKDDCINVCVEVEILKTTGVPCLEELIKRKCNETLFLPDSHSDDEDEDDGTENNDRLESYEDEDEDGVQISNELEIDENEDEDGVEDNDDIPYDEDDDTDSAENNADICYDKDNLRFSLPWSIHGLKKK